MYQNNYVCILNITIHIFFCSHLRSLEGYSFAIGMTKLKGAGCFCFFITGLPHRLHGK